jgi:hypothetical protein
VDNHATEMRLWAEANAHRPVARKVDWNKTFSGWLRRAKPNTIPLEKSNSAPLEREATEAEIAAWRQWQKEEKHRE